jgi:hypothetical protein
VKQFNNIFAGFEQINTDKFKQGIKFTKDVHGYKNFALFEIAHQKFLWFFALFSYSRVYIQQY